MSRSVAVLLLLALPLVAVAPAEAGWEEGVAAFKGGNFTQAAKEFQAVIQERPDWGGGHYMLGLTLQKLSRNEEALSNLRQAYDLNPGDVSYQMALAKAYLDNRRYNDAAQLLSKINPAALTKAQQGAYHQMTSIAYEQTGQSDRALASLQQVVAANPNDADSQFRFCLAAYNAGRTAEAVPALEKAVRLDPNDAEKKAAFIKVLIRAARESTGNAKLAHYQKAVQVANELAGKQPTYENLLVLGEVQLGAQDYAGAASAFAKAAAKNGSDWLVHFYLGQAQTSLGQFREAEATLRTALTRASGDREQRTVWGQIGFVSEKLKDFSAARDAYHRAGDSAAVARVEENERIASENKAIEEENARLQAMEAERKKLEEQLKELPGGRPPA
jgi:tetratricopeptide (TPR) repeat protein